MALDIMKGTEQKLEYSLNAGDTIVRDLLLQDYSGLVRVGV